MRIGPVRRIDSGVYAAACFAAFLPFVDDARTAGRVVSNSHCWFLLLGGWLIKL